MTADRPKKTPSPGQISWSAYRTRTAESKRSVERAQTAIDNTQRSNKSEARNTERPRGMTIFGVRLATTVGVDKRSARQAAFKKIGIESAPRRRWHQIAVETRTNPTGRSCRDFSSFAAKDKRNCRRILKLRSRSRRHSSWIFPSDQKVRPPETITH